MRDSIGGLFYVFLRALPQADDEGKASIIKG